MDRTIEFPNFAASFWAAGGEARVGWDLPQKSRTPSWTLCTTQLIVVKIGEGTGVLFIIVIVVWFKRSVGLLDFFWHIVVAWTVVRWSCSDSSFPSSSDPSTETSLAFPASSISMFSSLDKSIKFSAARVTFLAESIARAINWQSAIPYWSWASLIHCWMTLEDLSAI